MFSFCSWRLKAVEEIYWWPSGGFSHGWLILGLTSEVIFVSKSHLNRRFHTQGVSARFWRARKTIRPTRQIGFLVLCMNWPPGWHVVDLVEKERVVVQREATKFLVTDCVLISDVGRLHPSVQGTDDRCGLPGVFWLDICAHWNEMHQNWRKWQKQSQDCLLGWCELHSKW